MTDSNNEGTHAVRWAQASVGLLERFTKWHWTVNAQTTNCGRMIPVGGEVAFLPETDERYAIVDCAICKQRKIDDR